MFDVAIIGAGPGGYKAAVNLAQSGKSVVLFENSHIGGTCLNEGCIPTKTLLNTAKEFYHARMAKRFGVNAESVSVDFEEAQNWKSSTVKTLTNGIMSLLRKHKVEVVNGSANLIDSHTVIIEETSEEYNAENIIIATGSIPSKPFIEGSEDNPFVLDSTKLLNIQKIPSSICIVGGGVIGVEFASLFSMLGTKVSVIELQNEILPFMDDEHCVMLRKSLSGVDFYLNAKVESLNQNEVFFKDNDDCMKSVKADFVLFSLGRNPNLHGIDAEKLGIKLLGKYIEVDDTMRTSVPGIFAIGDVTGKSMLAHSAYRMADVVSNIILGKADSMDYDAVPAVVYSMPEASCVGLTEKEALKRGYSVKKAVVPMTLSGRFIAEHGVREAGSVKIVADDDTGRILGVHILGPYASEMIFGAVSWVAQKLTASELKKQIFPHPSVSEVLKDALNLL